LSVPDKWQCNVQNRDYAKETAVFIQGAPDVGVYSRESHYNMSGFKKVDMQALTIWKDAENWPAATDERGIDDMPVNPVA